MRSLPGKRPTNVLSKKDVLLWDGEKNRLVVMTIEAWNEITKDQTKS